jgi:hypothetical protein
VAITKEFLSGSTNGRPVKVTATGTPGTTIHTAHASAKDEVYLFATNTDTVDRELTIEFGGTTSPDDLIKVTVPAKDTVQVVPGVPLSGSLLARAFAAAANVVNVFGYVNRIS